MISRVAPGSLRFTCHGATTQQQISWCLTSPRRSWCLNSQQAISLGKPSYPLACPPCTKIRLHFRQQRQRSHCIGTADLLLHPMMSWCAKLISTRCRACIASPVAVLSQRPRLHLPCLLNRAAHRRSALMTHPPGSKATLLAHNSGAATAALMRRRLE